MGVKLERRCDESSIYDRNVSGTYWPGFQVVFPRLLPRLGYQSDVWAVAHRLCRLIWKILHEGVRFIEQGHEADPQTKERRARMLARALRKVGYEGTITPVKLATARKRNPHA
jgi:hypothetical protein